MNAFKNLITTLCLLCSHSVAADIFWAFRDEQGATNWQYVANFSSSMLILALSFTALKLFLSRRQAHRYNLELEQIRRQLEQRVEERTANLNQTNQLLQSSNAALAEEIDGHLNTTSQLAVSEAYITSILRSMPLVVIGLDDQNRITQWNLQAESVSRLNAADVIGRELWDCYPTISLTPDQVDRARREQKTLAIKQSQDNQYHFNITIYPLQEQLENGVVILIDNVTDQVNANNLLIQRDKMSSMGEMAAVMAQDINLPLSASLKDIQAVRSALTEESVDLIELNELLENALIRGQQATHVIENLLAFSTGGGGEKELASVAEILDHSLELAASLLSAPSGLRFRDITIVRDYSDSLAKIPCHVGELQQVFISLFRHACQSLGELDDPEKHPEIRIQASQQDHFIVLCIHHNGMLIGLDEQQYIFEPLASQSAGDKRYPVSSRLSFTHFIVADQHQGNIAVTSSERSGTNFHLQLPLAS